MNADRPLEIAWFGALCDDDYEYLGVPDPALASTLEHCGGIVAEAERQGFDSILLPSGYDLGIDTWTFAAAVAPTTATLRLLAAVRCGEEWPPTLARRIATLDRMLGGRLLVNIISSDLPGAPLDSAPRYARTLEVMTILRELLDGRPVRHEGEHYRLEVAPPRERTVSGSCPPLYFGGLSDAAREVAAQAADVYLMWPDTLEGTAEVIADMRTRAAGAGRSLRFGFRVHVIVRDTEDAARAEARRLLSRLDGEAGAAIRGRSLDAASAGVARQAELRADADDEGYIERHLWTGIGRARSGCGAAIVGDPDQVAATIRAYERLGIDTFILSGYPHRVECERFGRSVLPLLRAG